MGEYCAFSTAFILWGVGVLAVQGVWWMGYMLHILIKSLQITGSDWCFCITLATRSVVSRSFKQRKYFGILSFFCQTLKESWKCVLALKRIMPCLWKTNNYDKINNVAALGINNHGKESLTGQSFYSSGIVMSCMASINLTLWKLNINTRIAAY